MKDQLEFVWVEDDQDDEPAAPTLSSHAERMWDSVMNAAHWFRPPSADMSVLLGDAHVMRFWPWTGPYPV